ncbi:fumarylacetoacetate hydrolase family protein [Nitratireductor rhodophyticola]|uniref:fumarylacetoacetate hydrolase family protein n=1 Tax=Nitratireductor rhodophyticola TaxID=2854036 RepID=UPI002AC9E60A|nr:fumarylacetoacetate hydrolase family protein [Nitratireductor rhodophyticola]WPZ12448.1 fumarylacetoacetate hydrolase family protein [Nitratireductor rhodophyticola]
MKFLRIGTEGAETPCVLDDDGVARDVSGIVGDFTPETIPTLVERLSEVSLGTLPAVSREQARIGTPMTQPRNIYCIGLNYSDHAAEAGMAIPTEPILFNKSAATYCAPNAPILFSPRMTKLDWEVELGIVIGKRGLNVSKVEAMNHILGFTVVNDVSERAWQLDRGGQWAKGKCFPNFCPTGPLIVTPEEAGNASDLSMWLDVNGERMQTGNTRTMIFDAATIVSYLSEFMILEPGDLICTGTPPGVGMGKKPPRYLAVGDVVSLGIEGLGTQTQTVIDVENASWI